MKNRKQYVVGYVGDVQCVYGPDRFSIPSLIHRLTYKQAQRDLKKLRGPEPKTIYKLVPVK